MVHVCVLGENRQYSEDTLLKDVAKEVQESFSHEILLATVDGKLQELHKKVKEGTSVEFLTAADKPGIQTYRRSVLLILLKAFYEVIGAEHIQKVSVEYAIANGLFIESAGSFEKTQELVDRIKAKMREYVAAEIPIMKRNVTTDEAIEIFRHHRMYEKERLFRYRRVSRVNLYSIGGFEDYYYGYMVQNTGYLKYFDLIPYHSGFLLLLPETKAPRKVEKSGNHEKLFQVLRDSYRWSDCLEVPNVGTLNRLISEGKAADLILMQEALQEKTIGNIAEQAAKAGDKRLVMIAGPSSSGKTTFSHRLATQFRALGYTPHPIAVDNYFKNREDYPRDENGKLDMEALECVDIEKFNEDMNGLLNGRLVEIPRFNFVTGTREYNGDFLKLGKNDVLIIEGIHCLNDKLSYSLPAESRFKIYISALTQLNVDEHNRIPTADGRIIRRMVRDARTRGTSALETIRRWSSVRRGEDKNIFPFQEQADVMFNSALVYELAVLKQYAEPLLFGIPQDAPEYAEAKRLLQELFGRLHARTEFRSVEVAADVDPM